MQSKSLEYDKSLPHKAHQAPEGATRLLFNGNIKGKIIFQKSKMKAKQAVKKISGVSSCLEIFTQDLSIKRHKIDFINVIQ